MNIKILVILTIAVTLPLAACQPDSKHAEQVCVNHSDRILVGKIQRKMHLGMSSDDVVTALGSPNMVTTDEQHLEEWSYDKIAVDHLCSKKSDGVGSIIIVSPSAIIDGKTGGSASDAKSTQEYINVIVMFDKNHKVTNYMLVKCV